MKKTEIQVLVQNKHQLDKIREDSLAIKLNQFEDRMIEQCMQIIAPVLDFAKVDPSNPDLRPEEILHMGEVEQTRWMRLALAAWASNKDAPIGIKEAFATLRGILNARAKKESGDKVLNIETANFTSPNPKFEEMEVEE